MPRRITDSLRRFARDPDKARSAVARGDSASAGTRAEHFYRAAGWRAVGSAVDGEIRFELSAGDSPGTATRV